MISVDDARNSPKVKPYAESKGWHYEVYLDENGDFSRAIKAANVPNIFLINGKREIVWSKNSYAEGDEQKLLENVKKVKADQKIN